jgi:peptidoglycan/LPS O-acetylase OafA/YrhL
MTQANDRRKSLYRPELDVVRFIAFASVFVHHIQPRSDFMPAHASLGAVEVGDGIFNAAGFGLCLFFALSAYLICDLLLRERHATGTVKIGAFYRRRILRIWPLYLLGLLIGVFYALATHYYDKARLLAYLLMAGNWYCMVHGWTANPMLPLWSISVEEQFYLFWPAVARWFSVRKMYLLAGVMILVANGWLVYYGQIHADVDITIWTNSFVQFEMFAAGILLALVLHQRMPQIHAALRWLLFLFWPAAWFVSVYVFHAKARTGSASSLDLTVGYGLAALGSVSLILSLLGLRAELIPRWASYLGRISYGLYVFHSVARVPVMYIPGVQSSPPILPVLLQLALTVALAALSYRFFETPFLRMKARAEVISTRPI